MSESAAQSSARPSLWWPLVVATTAIAITQVPFWLGERWAPQGGGFDGTTGMTHDQNMYFSFIRQGAEGKLLFLNRLTHIEHRPALINVQWFAVGRAAHWLGGSVDAAYALWRVVGSVLLVLAFWWLSAVAGLNSFQRRWAVVLCAFGGGFGWIFLVLERGGLISPLPIAQLDISDAVHPFSHIFFNPHLSLSHGLSLLFLAAFARGEQTGTVCWYLTAAGVAVLHGLTRPYDLILISGALPLYILVDRAVAGSWTMRTTLLRCVPLVAIAPVVAYYAALFQLHPVFKHWASQGVVKPTPLHWHLFSLGVACLLCLVRFGLFRRFPVKTSTERLLIVWLVSVLFLYHAHKLPWLGFMPYTPVFGMTLASVLLLLGAPVLDENGLAQSGRGTRIVLLAAFVTTASLGSVVWMAKIFRNLRNLPEHYIPPAEHEAYAWLGGHAQGTDVIFAPLSSGNRMAKFISARFVLGHLSVTPNLTETAARVERFYRGKMTAEEARALLDEWNITWIYRGPDERLLGDFDPATIPGVRKEEELRGGEVMLYSCHGKRSERTP